MSRHHYSNAYHALLDHRRSKIHNLIEVGIGEDTAPSIAAWARYLPHANLYALDNKKLTDIKIRQRDGTTDRLKARQRSAGCEHDDNLWNSRVHLTTDTDATDPKQVAQATLPADGTADIIIDDGSHRLSDQEKTLALLWPKLAEDGIYIIEDVFVGALPWSKDHAFQAPTTNEGCGHECYYPQKLWEHPLMFDRFNVGGRSLASRPSLLNSTKAILKSNDWFWTVTGVHQGGGVDCSVIIRKNGTPRDVQVPPLHPECADTGFVVIAAMLSMFFNIMLAATLWFRRRHYVRLSQDGLSD